MCGLKLLVYAALSYWCSKAEYLEVRRLAHKHKALRGVINSAVAGASSSDTFVLVKQVKLSTSEE
jgi:hypothetical protein